MFLCLPTSLFSASVLETPGQSKRLEINKIKTMKKYTTFLLAAILFLIGGYFWLGHSVNFGSVGSNKLAFGFKGTTTSTVVSIGTQSSTVLGVNPDADFRQICLAPSSSLSTLLSLKLVNGTANGNVSTSTSGLILATSTATCLTFTQTNPYVGGVNAACNQSCWADILDY